jgi:hypothetical protein
MSLLPSFRYFADTQGEAVPRPLPAEVVLRRGIDADRVEPWTQREQQLSFACQRGSFVAAYVPIDALDAHQQTAELARQTLRVGRPITRHSPAEIFRFADIQHAFSGAAH